MEFCFIKRGGVSNPILGDLTYSEFRGNPQGVSIFFKRVLGRQTIDRKKRQTIDRKKRT